MKVIKSKWYNKIKSEFGSFDIIPDKDCEIYTFKDYESSLLIVRENTFEQANSGKPYTPKMYVLDPKTGNILNRKDYEKYFDYNPTRYVSSDGKWESVKQRKIDKNGEDYIEERIKNLETGETLSPAIGTAFRQSKYETWIDRYHEQLRRLKIKKSKLTLDQLYEKCRQNLKTGDIVFKYGSKNSVFKLTYNNGKFDLSAKSGKMNQDPDWDKITEIVKVYNDVEAFWTALSKEENWYKIYKPVRFGSGREKLIAKYIIGFRNNMVKENFKNQDVKEYQSWLNSVYTESLKRSEYKQYCANCRGLVNYFGRYPKYICDNCVQLLTDRNGREIEFYNTEMMGTGCQGYYTGTEQKEKYDSDIAYINDREFYAEEARFGGIVIQLKE